MIFFLRTGDEGGMGWGEAMSRDVHDLVVIIEYPFSFISSSSYLSCHT